MEQDLLQALLIFCAGLFVGMLLMLLVNKLRSGSASPGKVKQEFDDYQAKVETHFEETSQKFKDMTEQYQDLYKHLSVGATTLCRADSVAAVGLANQSQTLQPAKLEKKADQAPVTDPKAAADRKAPAAEPKKAAPQNGTKATPLPDKGVVTSKSAVKGKPAAAAGTAQVKPTQPVVKPATGSAKPSAQAANTKVPSQKKPEAGQQKPTKPK